MRREVERTVREKCEHGPHRPDGDPDIKRIVAARALHFSAPDRTAGPTEQMRAQEIPADTPDHEEHGHRTDDSQLHEELQEVVVGHAHVDLAGLEHCWLVVPVDVSVCAETDAQHGKGSEHRECREGEYPSARVVRVSHASEEGLEADPDGVAEGDHHKRADDREAPANSMEPAQQDEEDDERQEQTEHPTATQREDQGQRHDDQRNEGQVLTYRLLSPLARTETGAKPLAARPTC